MIAAMIQNAIAFMIPPVRRICMKALAGSLRISMAVS